MCAQRGRKTGWRLTCRGSICGNVKMGRKETCFWDSLAESFAKTQETRRLPKRVAVVSGLASVEGLGNQEGTVGAEESLPPSVCLSCTRTRASCLPAAEAAGVGPTLHVGRHWLLCVTAGLTLYLNVGSQPTG